MPDVLTCAFSTLASGVQNIIPNGFGAWPRSRQRNWAHGKAKENRIAFKILSAVQLLWWVDVMVNSSVFYNAVVFLWGFRLRVAPLSLVVACALENLKEKT